MPIEVMNFTFRYLIGCDNALAKLHTKHPELCDKVGGLLAMHIDDLRALAPLWLSKTEEVREDRAHWSTNLTGDIYGKGWISEMYGYSFGAAEVSCFEFLDKSLYPLLYQLQLNHLLLELQFLTSYLSLNVLIICGFSRLVFSTRSMIT